jgi:hypothetical protein
MSQGGCVDIAVTIILLSSGMVHRRGCTQCRSAAVATLQDAVQMADWAKQVVNLSRELGVYKNQCAHHYEAWIRATQLLQVTGGPLASWTLTSTITVSGSLVPVMPKSCAHQTCQLFFASFQLKPLHLHCNPAGKGE